MTQSLETVAQALVAPGKGVLAADESSGTIKKRFDAIEVENTQSNRRDYRAMLFRSTEAMSNDISGVILDHEIVRQQAKDGTPLVKIIAETGALPGIKVDMGAKPLPFCPGETITEGLDGLSNRIKDYVALGAKFSKWRAVIDIGRNMPSYNAINANAQALARYAALCVEGGLVPIVEPEVLMDGDHDIDTCEKITEWVLKEVYAQLYYARVPLEATVLKPNMVISGKKCSTQARRQDVAERTVKVLRRSVPVAVPGIVFLSGGQSDEDATAHLSLMNAMGPLPWKLSFSYGRALQAAAQKAWAGKPENYAAGQRAFSHRAKMNGAAALGKWSQGMEKAA